VIVVEPFWQADPLDAFNSNRAEVEMAKDGLRRLFIKFPFRSLSLSYFQPA